MEVENVNVEEMVEEEVVMKEEDKETMKMDVEIIIEDEVNVKEIVMEEEDKEEVMEVDEEDRRWR